MSITPYYPTEPLMNSNFSLKKKNSLTLPGVWFEGSAVVGMTKKTMVYYCSDRFILTSFFVVITHLFDDLGTTHI